MARDPGSLICDRFWLLHRLGRGALGELWCAADRVPDRRVALRVLDGPAAANAHALADAVGEARRARAVRSAFVEQTLDVGITRDGTREAPWIATELLHGEHLGDVLARRGRLLPGTALELVAALADALAAVHAAGLLHLGVAPARVLLHRGPDARITPKLLELGVAPLRAAGDAGDARDAADAADAGADPCASPELASEPSAACDVWSLGILLFRACTGAWPPARRGHALGPPGRIDGVAGLAELDARVRHVLAGCLAPRPADRPSAAALAAEARFVARRARGGFVDLARMVRVPERASIGAGERLGISHFPTLPSLGGGPPPRRSLEGPIAPPRARAAPRPSPPAHEAPCVPSDAPTPTPVEPISDITLALVASVRDEIGSLPELRPGNPRKRVLIGLAAAALVLVAAHGVAVRGPSIARRAARPAAASVATEALAQAAETRVEGAKDPERVERVAPAQLTPAPATEPPPPTGAGTSARPAAVVDDALPARAAATEAPRAVARPVPASASASTGPEVTTHVEPKAPVAIGNLTGVPLLDTPHAAAPPGPPDDTPYE